MAWVVRNKHKDYLIHCDLDNDAVKFVWLYKRGSAHMFETEAEARVVAFLCNGEVEEKE